jgi:hypothetical protein
LAIPSLWGFGGRRNRDIWNGSPFWEGRTRNKKSMILKKNNPNITRQMMIREKQDE